MDGRGAHEDGVNAVVDEIDLSTAREFLFYGGLDEVGIEVRDYGVDRQAILGGRFDHAHVPDAQQ
ncbi:MAG: hypothetical protein WDO18_12480 [Acidobacteriota bacterium]